MLYNKTTKIKLILSLIFTALVLMLDISQIFAKPLRFADSVNWTTIKQIEMSLKGTPPMNVGFDIDDTSLFTKSSHYLMREKHCPNDTNVYHDKCSASQDYWDDLSQLDYMNPPKETAKLLIEMHKKRGDKIYFITARESPTKKQEKTTSHLKKTFKINKMPPVIFVGLEAFDPKLPSKAIVLKKKNIKIYYGDADSDILAAQKADTRPIRVMRASNSQDNKAMPINGRFGEEVIIDSDV
tara:strand:- start:3323 stop:4042 length:720 start_codon:yes stop_codon:yes gene_type:complete